MTLDHPEVEAKIHFLRETPLASEVVDIQSAMYAEFGREQVDRRISWTVFARHSIILNKCRGAASVLDVGVGQANFANALTRLDEIHRVAGVDIKRYEMFKFLGEFEFEFEIMDVTTLRYHRNEFEIVTAQEVLEHLGSPEFEKALQNLRHVARRKLILTVPFCEPSPLIPGHFQQFTPQRIIELFPNAHFELLLKHPVTSVPWILVEETYREGLLDRSRRWIKARPRLHSRLLPVVNWCRWLVKEAGQRTR